MCFNGIIILDSPPYGWVENNGWNMPHHHSWPIRELYLQTKAYFCLFYQQDRPVKPLTVRITILYPAFFYHISYGRGWECVGRYLIRLVSHPMGMGWVGVSLHWSITCKGGGKEPPGVGWVDVSLGLSITPWGGVCRCPIRLVKHPQCGGPLERHAAERLPGLFSARQVMSKWHG